MAVPQLVEYASDVVNRMAMYAIVSPLFSEKISPDRLAKMMKARKSSIKTVARKEPWEFSVVVSYKHVKVSDVEALDGIHRASSQYTYSILSALQLSEIALNVRGEGHLTSFHSQDYIDALKAEAPNPLFFSGDAEPFKGVFNYALSIVDGTCTAVDMLLDDYEEQRSELSPVTMFWQGGRHHAQPNMSAGYCWLNDCVVGIYRMKELFDNILYVDLDYHHGDGVCDAF